MKIVVRGTNWIGDAMMTIPALRALRRSFPTDEIVLLTRSWADGVFHEAEFVDRLLSFDATGSRRRDLAAQRRLLMDEQFDLAVLFTNSFESALAVSLARIPGRIGYAKEGRGVFLTEAVPIPGWKNERHEIHYYLNLVEQAAIRFGGKPLEKTESGDLRVSDMRRANALGFWRTIGFDVSRPIVAFGAGSTNSNAKRWPTASYARLNDLLQTRLGAQVALFGTADEIGVAQKIAAEAEAKPLILAGRSTLAETVALLSSVDLLISNDSGLAHVAPAVGTQTIVIFGPTDERTTRPIGSEIIRKPFDCAPCMLRECPIDHRCMTSITPEDVFAKAAELIGK
jgi:heptosyltransferase-2